MGGSIFEDTVGLDAKSYYCLKAEITEILEEEAVEFFILPAYRNKPSFGDIDILIKKESIEDINQFITNTFEVNRIVSNGPVKSFSYNNFQVDLILTSSDDWISSCNYYSWNDLGNYVGKVAHVLGFKYGHKGLDWNYYSINRDRVIERIHLSKDPEVILPFLGFSYNRWKEGFDSKEEIFEFIINSKYFNPEIFQFNNLSSKHKHRNKKRKLYIEFLEYIEGKPFTYKVIEPFSKEEIQITFPDFSNKLNEINKKELIKQRVKHKFNGRLVMDKYPELKDKELGQVINLFKASVYSQGIDYDKFIIESSVEDLWKRFNEILNKFRGRE